VENADNKATLTSQRFADGTAIANATTASFTPSSAELGKRLTVQLTKLNGSAKSKSVATASAKAKGKTKTSKPSAPVVLGVVTPSTVTLLGEGQVGRVLVAVKVAKSAGASTAVDKVAYDLANWATRAAAILRTVNL